MKPMSTTTKVHLAKILFLEKFVLRFFCPSLSSCSKLSITGDTAKILVSNSAEVVHFHLKTQLAQTSYAQGVHYGKERIEKRSFRRRIQPHWQDPFDLSLLHLLVKPTG